MGVPGLLSKVWGSVASRLGRPSDEARAPNLTANELSLAAEEKIRRVLATPDRAQIQAQVGFSTASAFLGGLTATGGATGFLHEADWVIALGASALFVWGLVAALFVRAQTASETEPPSQGAASEQAPTPRLLATPV